MTPCSATEPQQVYPTAGPYPAVCRDGGARVRIFQADTGLVTGAAANLPVARRRPRRSRPAGRTVRAARSSPYGGHGTFVAGVLRCMAPQAQVHVENIFDTGGSALESDVATRLNAAFGFGFEIVHITASCHTRKNTRRGPGSLAGAARSYKGVVCVAEAGNNHTKRPAVAGRIP